MLRLRVLFCTLCATREINSLKFSNESFPISRIPFGHANQQAHRHSLQFGWLYTLHHNRHSYSSILYSRYSSGIRQWCALNESREGLFFDCRRHFIHHRYWIHFSAFDCGQLNWFFFSISQLKGLFCSRDD